MADPVALVDQYRADLERASSLPYARFRLALLQRIQADRLTPLDMARVLESAGDTHPEICLDECRRYREMGSTWEPWETVHFAANGQPYAAHPWQDTTVRGRWKHEHREAWRAARQFPAESIRP